MIFTRKTRNVSTKYEEITVVEGNLGLLHVALCGSTIETPLR